MKFTAAVLTTLSLVAGSMAHMRMVEPEQWKTGPFLQDPLAADGSDFPCQNAHNEISSDVLNTPSASYTPGGKGTLRVLGGATHGGGSGQMVITYDLPPTKDSVWRVLHSWEGDHPIKSEANASQDPEQQHPAIEFNIPEGLPAGKATVAWNWFNRIGNREHYMKCATVEVLGGGNDSGYDSLPAAFRANSNGCVVPENTGAIDFGISDARYVTIAPGAQPVPIACGGGGGGSVSGGAPEQDTTEGGGSAEKEVPVAPTPEPVAPTPEPTTPQPTTPDHSSSGGACVEGTTVCSEGNTWSQCGSGMLQNMGQVPAGLTCQNGQLIAKRSVRFSAEHRRHRSRHV